jgi:thymidylate synthase
MKQYLDLLQTIKQKGTTKPAARAGMPGSLSLFGYQFRHDLSEGFPLLTTKKIKFENIVHELLWFLRGDTNIKYLVDNGVNIWNEDAYNYYSKLCKELCPDKGPCSYEGFIDSIKVGDLTGWAGLPSTYRLGDCGFQYGKVWREWEKWTVFQGNMKLNNPKAKIRIFEDSAHKEGVDQIQNIINALKKNPESRRHLVTAVDPAHDTDLALYWCHAMFQFNCRPLTHEEKYQALAELNVDVISRDVEEFYKNRNLPQFYLDCQLYQRSADVVLGVPYNIASYSLLIHIISKICNMIPGEFIHTFGDVHIYDNHMDAVKEQLNRYPTDLPTFKFSEESDEKFLQFDQSCTEDPNVSIDDIFNELRVSDFILENYNPQGFIKATLSTGLK